MSQISGIGIGILPPIVPTTFRTTAGDAIPALNILTLANGANITFSGAASTITAALSGTTDHALQVGNVGGSLTSLAVGDTGEVLIGNTGADPSFSANPTVTSITSNSFLTGNPAVAASILTLNGNTISADGTAADVDVNITTQGSGCLVYQGISTGYANSMWHTCQAAVQTTDATPTGIFTIPLNEGEMVSISLTVNGFSSDFSNALSGSITSLAAYRPTGGDITQIGEEVENSACTSTASILAYVAVGTQSISLVVVGVAAETWNWTVTYQYMFTVTSA